MLKKKIYWIFGGLILGLSLFGPRGLIHWVWLKNEKTRLENKLQQALEETNSIKSEISRFQKSKVAKERAIREELGYIKQDEYSVEILDSVEPVKSQPMVR